MIAAIALIALALGIVGVVWRVTQYARTPQHRHMPLTPAPFTRRGQTVRVLSELFLFKTLFRSSFGTWLFAWLFHAGLLWLVLFHINLFAQLDWNWLTVLSSEVKFASLITMVGLIGLLFRRLVVPRVRYISSPSDYLWLVFLLVLVSTGFLMRWTGHNDIGVIRSVVNAALEFEVSSGKLGWLLNLHLLLAAIVFIVFPFSKLLHAPGFFLSPSIMTRDKKRTQESDED